MGFHFQGLTEISDRIRRQEIRASDVTEALIERTEALDARLKSTTMVLADAAREQACLADAEIRSGLWRGPLHGVPIGIKDNLALQGLPTGAGTTLLTKWDSPCDATVVQRLKRAGAVLIAKLHLTEGATLHYHPSMPRSLNPWSEAHWTGVSSSGSGVATAAGFCFGSIGTDTGGSIRLPCSANNLTGIKPTWGRVSRHGLVPNSDSLDHVGPMARSTADAAAILQAIAGDDIKDPTTSYDPVPDYSAIMKRGVDGLTLGIDWTFATSGMADEIVHALHHAIEVFQDLGMRVREISMPGTDEDLVAFGKVYDAEVALAHAEHFPAEADQYGPYLRDTLLRANASNPIDVAHGFQTRDRFRGMLGRLFRDVDMMITPGIGRVLPTWAEIDAMGLEVSSFDFNIVKYSLPFNVGGVPTISLPGGFTKDGLPIGLQLVGPWLSEAVLIRAGFAFQRVTPFHTRHPDLNA